MKGKEKAPRRMLNEIEASQLSDIQFKAMIIGKLNELTKNCEKLQGNYYELTKKYINMKEKQKLSTRAERKLRKQLLN